MKKISHEFKGENLYVRPKSLLRQIIQKLFLDLLSKIFSKRFLSYKNKIRLIMNRSGSYLRFLPLFIYLRFKYLLYLRLPFRHILAFHTITKFLEILKPLKIDFFLLGAPLLGAVRQGCFAGTKIGDVDIGMKEEQLPKLLKAFPLIIKKSGARTIRAENNNKIIDKTEINNKIEKIQILFSHILIDIVVYRKKKKGKDEMWIGDIAKKSQLHPHSEQNADGFTFPIADLEHLIDIKAYGKKFLSPSNPEIYLEKIYGPNWRIPAKKQFFWNKQSFIKKQISDVNTYGARELFRKFYLLIKFFSTILMDIIAIVPCIIIRLISPWFIVRIQRISAGNFGEFIGFTATHYCQKKLNIDQPTKKHIDLFYIKNKIYNKQLEKMWKRKLIILSDYLLHPINRVNKLIPGWKKHTVKTYFSLRDIDILYEKYQPIEFTNDEEIYGKKILNKFGLKEGDKFVCLDVRDGAHQKKKISARHRNWSYHDYRHTDIDKFFLASEELTKRGYYVFRMGVIAEKPFNSKNPKIIDYVNSNLRCDFMDIYLGAKCSFCISTGSGYLDLPRLFRKPIAQMELPIGMLYLHNEKNMVITKHHVLKKEKRKLSLSEIFSHGVAYAQSTEIFKQKGVELVDNSSEEIKDLVIEMVENLEFKKKLNSEDEELQKTFRSLYASSVKRFDHHRNDIRYSFIFASIINDQIKSRFSTKFLRENKEWLR